MRILFAALSMPFPPTNGHRLRTWGLLRALADDGHEIALISFADPDEIDRENPELLKICRSVERIPAPGRSGGMGAALRGRIRALFSRYPYGAWRFRSPQFVEAVARRLEWEQFDLLICDGIYNVHNLPADLHVSVALNKDDVAHVIVRRYLAFERQPLRWLYGRLEARKIRVWERRACARVATTLVCSEVDRALLRQLCPSAPMPIVPNTVDTEFYAPAGQPEPLTALFQGGMDWHPNRDAVEFFAAAILPSLRRLVPGVIFRVAGRSPDDQFRHRLAAVPGLEFTGSVPDMRTEIARATVCVVPLRIGSGTRLKILEAGAMGKAIVSTRVGAEGLEFRDGEEILLVDEPEAFAETVAALLQDSPRRLRLGREARQRVQKDYSYPALQASLREALQTLRPPA